MRRITSSSHLTVKRCRKWVNQLTGFSSIQNSPPPLAEKKLEKKTADILVLENG